MAGGGVAADRERDRGACWWRPRAASRFRRLLVRGGSSELVNEAHVKEFLELVPHAEYVDVAGARHMVAGDQNDHFSAAVMDFLGKLDRKTVMRQS